MRLTDNLLAMLRNYDTLDEAMKDAIIEEEHLRGSPLANVYVIEGSSGSHSDLRTWLVSAYLTEKEAEVGMKILTDWLDSRFTKDKYGDHMFSKDEISECPDPQAKENYVYDGLTYRVFTVPLRTNE